MKYRYNGKVNTLTCVGGELTVVTEGQVVDLKKAPSTEWKLVETPRVTPKAAPKAAPKATIKTPTKQVKHGDQTETRIMGK